MRVKGGNLFMSERQARNKRKEQPVAAASKKGNSNILFNGILTAVIIAFVALGGVAVVDEYKKNDGIQTVKEYAKENDMSVDEFMSKFGLEGKDIKSSTEINEASASMPLDKYAEYAGTTVEALKEESGWGDEVTNEMTITEAQDYTKIGKFAESMGMVYADYLSALGLTEEELPADTYMKDAQPIIEAASAKMQEEAAATAEANAEAEAEGETAEGETAEAEAEADETEEAEAEEATAEE